MLLKLPGPFTHSVITQASLGQGYIGLLAILGYQERGKFIIGAVGMVIEGN